MKLVNNYCPSRFLLQITKNEPYLLLSLFCLQTSQHNYHSKSQQSVSTVILGATANTLLATFNGNTKRSASSALCEKGQSFDTLYAAENNQSDGGHRTPKLRSG